MTIDHNFASDLTSSYNEDGFVLLRGFYDVPTQIRPIHRGIFDLIGLIAEDNNVDIGERTFTADTFDAGYQTLIAKDRALGGVVYDAAKQLSSFVRLLGDQRNDDLLQILRPGSLGGVAANGYGIRIDNPSEDRYRAEWHQEYVGQLRSLEGFVMWSPLREMTQEIGPVQICPKSHLDGVLPVRYDDSVEGQSGVYSLRLADQLAPEKYDVIEPLLSPGDVVVMDFKTLHRSGFNVSQHSRWSMQFRLFDFQEQSGRAIGWAGSFGAGKSFETIHPELLVP